MKQCVHLTVALNSSKLLIHIAQQGSIDRLQTAWHSGRRVLRTASCGNAQTEIHTSVFFCIFF